MRLVGAFAAAAVTATLTLARPALADDGAPAAATAPGSATGPSAPATGAPAPTSPLAPSDAETSRPVDADVSGARAPSSVEERPTRPVRVTGTLGALSLPRLLSLEVLARFRKRSDPKWDSFAVGAGLDYLPPGIVNFGDKTTLSWLQVGADGRFFPYRWLFVGARVGYQFARADSEKFGSEVDYVTSSLFLAPKVGALYTFASGFTIGGELGATIPLFAGTSITSDGQTDANARKAAKTFGMFVMPFVALRVGWTF